MKQLIEEYLEDLEYRVGDLGLDHPDKEFIEGNKYAYYEVIRDLQEILFYDQLYSNK